MGQKLSVDEAMAGKRADVAASEAMPALSRSFVTRLINESRITVNGQATKPGNKLKQGDMLEINFDTEELEVTEKIELEILHEDSDVLVINKPAGIISHSRGHFWNEPSVASFVRHKTGQEGDRAGIVHRLDRATSGVMICAKNQAALSFLQKQFSGRKVRKTYLALVEGHVSPQTAKIDMPIERNPKKPQVFRAGANGKPSVTNYKVVETCKNCDKLELLPETGRTHQLRVHMNKIGHAIIGDALYGGKPADRLYLHAHKLELTLPGGERKIFTSLEPAEFMDYCKNG